MNLDLIMKSVEYVISAPLFWGSMGFTTATAMFAGVLLYDGQFSQIMKGLISVTSYAAMVFWVTISRITNVTSIPNYFSNNLHYAYAGIVTLTAVTLSWLLGLLIGVCVFRIKYGSNSKMI